MTEYAVPVLLAVVVVQLGLVLLAVLHIKTRVTVALHNVLTIRGLLTPKEELDDRRGG